jgi:glutamate 5-kinase
LAKTILIKVGTNVLTKEDKTIDLNQIQSLVNQIVDLKKQGHKVILVTSGAVGAGRQINEFKDVEDKVIRKQMLAAVGQNKLMGSYTHFFRDHNIVIAQALLTRSDFSNREKYTNMKKTLLALLDAGVVPVINENDVVSTEELSFSDNDILAAYTAALIRADKLVIMTVVDGFYNKDPSQPGSELVCEIHKVDGKLLYACGNSKSSMGTGGMASKIKAAHIATELGIEMVIINGKKETLQNVLDGKFIGTTFHPKAKEKKSVFYWLLAGATASGKVTVDDGAAEAVKKRKSLLFVGVVNIYGEFKKNDTLEVYDSKGTKIGVGLSNYSSEEAEKILQKSRKAQKDRKELIHVDNLKVF